MGYISIIADDLTGASDTGIQFRKYGLKTKVIVDPDILEQFLDNDEVLAINSNTRPLKSEKAYKRVYDISCKLKKAGFSRIYKKVDSTFRGNPGIELEAVMDAYDAKLAIVAPSFPDNGRCMIDGYLKVTSLLFNNNKNVKNNSLADEMEQELCHVPTLLQSNMRRKVTNINLKTVRKGSSAILDTVEKLYEEGYQVLTIDAVTKDDLNNIALACKLLPEATVLAGAAGFAAYLPKVMELSYNKLVKLPSKDGIILVVAGTCNPTTRWQIEEVLKNINANLVKIDTDKIISGMAREEVQNVVQKIQKHIKTEKIKTNPMIVAVDTLFKLTKENEFPINKWGKTIASAIGEIVGMLVEDNIVQCLVITGGDTALHVLNALKARGIDLEEEILAGIPSGRLFEGKAHDIPIVTKAGGFGSPMALLEVIEHLQNNIGAERILDFSGEA
ncbi:MAG: four-carbon acid sugar kinase family protein [Tepidanaerobacteraceae bacterium]|nr:four-carbon acid sugar kinase family protein [Tepidanaerobacteraceae bacterium]